MDDKYNPDKLEQFLKKPEKKQTNSKNNEEKTNNNKENKEKENNNKNKINKQIETIDKIAESYLEKLTNGEVKPSGKEILEFLEYQAQLILRSGSQDETLDEKKIKEILMRLGKSTGETKSGSDL